MIRNYRPADAAQIAADIAELEQPLPEGATDWARNAQETTLTDARQALAALQTFAPAPGAFAPLVWRGVDDDGLYYLIGECRSGSIAHIAQQIVDERWPEGAPFMPSIPEDKGERADAQAAFDLAFFGEVQELLAAAGIAAHIFLHDGYPGEIRVMDAGLLS